MARFASKIGKIGTGSIFSPTYRREKNRTGTFLRIGVLGGSFNPIHFGHLRLAEEAREALRLDRVLFIPALRRPHKPQHGLVDGRHRLAMVRLAIAGQPAFAVSDVELQRPGPSYTVDTLMTLRRQSGARARLFFLCGADTLQELKIWKDLDRVLQLCTFVVATRPGYPWRPRRGLTRLTMTPLAISASDIRRRVAEQHSIRYLVPDAVERYIARHRLYP